MEPGSGNGDRHQSVGGAHHAACADARVGLRAQSGRIAHRFICGGSVTPAAVSALHSNGCIPVSLEALAAQSAANRASQPSSRAPVSCDLAMGMACAGGVGHYGCYRNAFAGSISSTHSGADDASSSDAAAFAPSCELGRSNQISVNDRDQISLYCRDQISLYCEGTHSNEPFRAPC